MHLCLCSAGQLQLTLTTAGPPACHATHEATSWSNFRTVFCTRLGQCVSQDHAKAAFSKGCGMSGLSEALLISRVEDAADVRPGPAEMPMAARKLLHSWYTHACAHAAHLVVDVVPQLRAHAQDRAQAAC